MHKILFENSKFLNFWIKTFKIFIQTPTKNVNESHLKNSSSL